MAKIKDSAAQAAGLVGLEGVGMKNLLDYVLGRFSPKFIVGVMMAFIALGAVLDTQNPDTLTIILLGVFFIFVVWALLNVLFAPKQEVNKTVSSSVAEVLKTHGGGIYKRIDENRELVEFLQNEAPDFLEKHPWVIGSWLKSQDSFLCDLAASVPKSKKSQFKYEDSPAYPRPWPKGDLGESKSINH